MIRRAHGLSQSCETLNEYYLSAYVLVYSWYSENCTILSHLNTNNEDN